MSVDVLRLILSNPVVPLAQNSTSPQKPITQDGGDLDMSQLTAGTKTHGAGFDSKRLLPNVLDGLAAEQPGHCWAKIPVSATTYDSGYRSLTYAQLANAVDHLAWRLVETLGQGQRCPTLAYFGPWDPRYVMLVFAANKAGYKVSLDCSRCSNVTINGKQLLLPSPSYAAEGIVRLLNQTQCKTILTSSKRLPVVSKIAATQDFQILDIDPVETILQEPRRAFPFAKTFEEAHSEPLCILHTSGSTGSLKPIVWSHEWASNFMRQTLRTAPEGFESQEKQWQGGELFPLLPAYHVSLVHTE
ncbi:MAG: hypothetical protein Q9162_003468 [Coniocarpon cinnabarinum]